MSPPPDHPRTLLPPPQFGLRTLLLAVTAIGFLLALAQHLSPLAITVGVFLLITIAAHVAASALGARLRGAAPERRLPLRSTSPVGAPAAPVTPPVAIVSAPQTNLSQKQPLGRSLVIAAVLGLALGGFLGAVGSLPSGRPLSWAPVALGGTAFGVLGALAAVLATGFVQAAWSAWREALRHHP